MQWFGESWGAPICSHTEHTATPAGKSCIECDVEIHLTDSGVILPYLSDNGLTEAIYHRACFLRSIWGRDRAQFIEERKQ